MVWGFVLGLGVSPAGSAEGSQVTAVLPPSACIVLQELIAPVEKQLQIFLWILQAHGICILNLRGFLVHSFISALHPCQVLDLTGASFHDGSSKRLKSREKKGIKGSRV